MQDSWTVTDRLTLNYGLRYDIEWLSKYRGLDYGHDTNNFGPRLALSYDLTGKGANAAEVQQRPVLRSDLPEPDHADVLREQGNPAAGRRARGTSGPAGAPVYPQTFDDTSRRTAPLGVRNVYIVPDEGKMSVPASYQAGGDDSTTPSATIWRSAPACCYSSSWDKERLYDRNLVFNDATQRFVRPDPNFRVINQYAYEGKAEYTGLVLEARKRMRNGFFFSANATVARAFDEGNNFSSQVERPPVPGARVGAAGGHADVPHDGERLLRVQHADVACRRSSAPAPALPTIRARAPRSI